jgi:hypothetical protein
MERPPDRDPVTGREDVFDHQAHVREPPEERPDEVPPALPIQWLGHARDMGGEIGGARRCLGLHVAVVKRLEPPPDRSRRVIHVR